LAVYINPNLVEGRNMFSDLEDQGEFRFDPADIKCLIDDLCETDSDSSDCNHLMKKARIADLKKMRKLRIPRLLSKDIRKMYSLMFVNVINSYNFPLIYGFFDTYYNQTTVEYAITKYSPTNAKKLYTMNFYGLDEVAKFWYANMRISPDNVVILQESSIQPFMGKIVCRFQKRATQVYVDPPGSAGYFAPHVFVDKKYGKEILYANDKVNNDFVVGNGTSDTSSTSDESMSIQDEIDTEDYNRGNEKISAIQKIMNSVDSVVDQLPLCDPPRTVVADGMFIISTDENKRICKIEVHLTF